ncbi:unnamed protein product [Medioppia subpectinata]|uniref:Nuclear receptor corepressor 1 n=1 Tax=Medioppia subpectinata TaxID=1979941 RepID=A0A7R9KC95_9ACAR|nr:unnamed protein product [Medioppia subpectinata]CAG2100531.1 unnamed protein product [Medioppia subpectinata]
MCESSLCVYCEQETVFSRSNWKFNKTIAFRHQSIPEIKRQDFNGVEKRDKSGLVADLHILVHMIGIGSLHESSGGYLHKRHTDHLSPTNIPGTRVYPYPGTTQEPVRNSYHHSTTHSAPISHHLSSLYGIGANSGHSAAAVPQVYRETNYSVDRHEFSPIDRYRNRNETNELHHSSGGTHSHVPTSSHSQPPLVRRRPSLLPHVPNEYSVLGANAALNSSYMNRERYDLAYRYASYESQTKGSGLQSSPMSMTSNTVSQHTGPSPLHMVHQGMHLPLAYPHQTQAIVSSAHIPQSHTMSIIQDMTDMNANKRPRLGFGNDQRSSLHQPLLIDTRDVVEVKKEPAYTPQVEAISPTLPNDDNRQDLSPFKTTKDELLQNINKIDREIMQTETQLTKLRKKQELELVTSQPSADNQELEESSGLESQLSVAQVIYSDNKAKTLKTHTQFDKLGPIIELPLYNQPSDSPVYHENKRKFISFKKKLIIFFKKRYQEKQLREHYLTDTYDKLMLSWLKKLEKKETNPPKKQKDVKLREYFEKQFPELRKQREDKERFSRVGQRIRSDAELEEIMDGLQEQELEDKKMRSYAVIPPILMDSRHKRHCFINRNVSTPVTTTTATTVAVTSAVNTITSTTNTTSSPDMSKVCDSAISVTEVAPDVKPDSIVNDSPIKCDNVINSVNNANNDENITPCDTMCCLCHTKIDNPSKSRPVTQSNLNVYNISDGAFKQGMRVCLVCHHKNVRRNCPLPSCKTPRRKVKRLKPFPQQWFELSAESRQTFANELNIADEVRTACPRCVMRVSRRIGLIAPSDRTDINQNNESPTSRLSCWTESEIELLKQSIRELGRNWSAIANQIRTKTDRECHDFYSKNKYSQHLDKILKEFLVNSGKTVRNADSDSDDYWNCMSEGDSEETSSAEEGNDRCNSDTASASSPISKIPDDIDTKLLAEKTDNTVCSTTNHNFREDFTKLQDYKVLSASQTSLKSDYDSSATMSADEGQGNGDNDRLSSSPAVILPPRANSAMPAFPPSNIYFHNQPIDKHVRPASHDAAFAIDMMRKSSHSPSVLRTTEAPSNLNTNINPLNPRQKVPPFLINPNAPSTQPSVNPSHVNTASNKEEPTCVRDLIYQAIEMSLQTPIKTMRPNSQQMVNNEINKMDPNDAITSSLYSLPNIKRENLLDISKNDMNRESPSRIMYKNADIQRPEGLAMMASYSQHLSPSSGHSTHPYVMVEPDEYEVQDLSAKKERRIDNYSPRNYSPSMKDKMMAHRNEYPYGLIPTAHSNPNRGSTPVTEPNVDIKDNYNLMKHMDSSGRLMNSNYQQNERIHSQDMKHSRASPLSRPLNKMPVTKGSPVPPPPPLITSGKPNQSYSQLSPKPYREKLVPVSTASGGSITQGTPGIPPNSYGYPPNRYEGLLRQIPPTGVHKEGGSITLGTPLMGGATNMPIDHRRKAELMAADSNRAQAMARNNPMYEQNMEQYYRRSSPPGTHSHPYSPAFQTSDFAKMAKPVFHKEAQLSTNQIMIDFNTSKQMLTRRGSNSSDKDIVVTSAPIHSHTHSAPMDSRSTHSNEHKNSSQNRQTNSYPNYSQNTSNSSSSAPIYPDRVPQRESQPPMMTSSDPHMSHWSVRHSSMGAQSPNYNRQNVIQHWNASNTKQSVIQTPKSSSPRDYRTEVISPVANPAMRTSVSPQVPMTSSLFSHQHVDAFTTLVNAAAAQQSLAVPSMERRPGSVSRTDQLIRSSIKPSAEGLEKSLIENFHGRPPRNYLENDLNKSDDKMRQLSHENDYKMFPGNRPPINDYMYLDQRRRYELDLADMERHGYNRSMAEHPGHSVSQPSLRFSREPFTKEQFEKEFVQQTSEPNRDPGIRLKTEDLEPTPEMRHSLPVVRPPMTELDNEASKLFSQSFQKDNQKANSSRGQFTAANLIDAIITHQINSSTEGANAKNNGNVVNNTPVSEAPPTGIVDSLFARYRNSEKHISSQYPNREEVVTIADSPSPDKGHHLNEKLMPGMNAMNAGVTPSDYSSKGITLGEHIDTLISKNYTNDGRTQVNPHQPIDTRSSPSVYGMPSISIEPPRSSLLPVVSTSSPVLEGIAAAAVSNAPSDANNAVNHSPPHSSWKLRKALQQDKDAKETDERQIVRIVQNVSPKEKSVYPSPTPIKSISPALSHYNVEPISPPTSHSTDNNSPHLTSTYNPMQTTWTPTTGVQTSSISSRHFYTADSSNVSNSPNLLKPMHQTVSTSNQLNVNSNRANQPQIGLSPIISDYVKNRIVEVMKNTRDESVDDSVKRVNNDMYSQQHEKRAKEDSEPKLSNDSNDRVVSIDSTMNINETISHISREISKSPAVIDTSIPVSAASSAPESISSSNSHNIVSNESESSEGTPAKRMKISSEQQLTDCGKVETTSDTKADDSMSCDKTASSDRGSIDSESIISQTSTQMPVNSNETQSTENEPKVSSEMINKPTTCEQSNCEVSSAPSAHDTNAGKPDPKHIYPDSPNSPGEMVIDESDHNLCSSSPPIDKTHGESPPTSNTTSTQQSLISTTGVVKSDSPNGATNSSAICSTSTSGDQNQSESVSSSVIETKSRFAEVSAPTSSAPFAVKDSPALAALMTNSVTPPLVATHSDAYKAVNTAANNVSSSALPSAESNTNAGDSTTKCSANTSGVSSSISTSGESVTKSSSQSTGSASIQSSAISGSGTPSSTTTSHLLAPQYEPLSDDEYDSPNGATNSSAICSTSTSGDQNQSESVSSSVIETKSRFAEVSAPTSSAPFAVKDSPALAALMTNSVTPPLVATHSDAYKVVNTAANNVSSSALPSAESNTNAGDSTTKCSANTSGVSSSISTSGESVTKSSSQSTGSASIQSSAISGSGTPSSTTTSHLLAPQYEPLSDDE